MNRAKKFGGLQAALGAAAVCVFLGATADTVRAENHDVLTEGDELLVYVDLFSGNSIQGGHLDAWLNEYPDSDDPSQIGGIGLVRLPDGCSELSCAEWHVGYCSEADVQIHAMEYAPYYEVNLDPRLSFLTWKYGYDFYIANYQSGNAIVPMAATQALMWAWHSDPQTGSTVFADVAGGLDDPLNWDGLTPSLHADVSPRVGFHGDDLDATHWTGTDEELLEDVTQAVYDLAVESTAKAGPWSLSQGVGATGVVLTGSNGPIEGEVITFDDGTAEGINVVTDASGYAAWPEGATEATSHGPGLSYETEGNSNEGEEGQNIVVTLGEHLAVSVNDPAPTTSTTTTVPPLSETDGPTTTTAETVVASSTIPDLTALPATGRGLDALPPVLLLATGSIGIFASRRGRLR